ncbi:zinc-dependent alcohol dehydrogenase family protein [Hymenobacter metallicola]|uniref:NAD(P)-dependent alcohol dehydrogenase n=1 Tax=Hymenobacter metallicola TaxID=2563114 RepID=A0A4Z0PZG5_9BACT|nr:NAD(P)-dependent alcohol dehydrogenase [Hymenobacter metallicola]TGE22714.1 NAD(P)-dependent alcohol dehydrogenase [Hymenobacter metallicola]
MQAFQLTQFGIDHLVPHAKPTPVPAPHEVLVRVQALSLNALDLMVIQGSVPVKLPHLPICDAAGIVEALGNEVTTLAVGDEVTSVFFPQWKEGTPTAAQTDVSQRTGVGLPGYLAEYVAVPATHLVRKPANLTPLEASTLPIAGLTAWNALKYTQLTADQTVLVHGTGGVSLFALQFAKARGCRVALTSKDDAKLARARELGADFTFNYATQPNWLEELRDSTDGRGAEAVIETVGGENLNNSIKAVAIGGHIAIMGLLAGTQASINVPALLAKQARIIGMQVGSTEDFLAMSRAIESSDLHPVIGQVYSVPEIQEALRSLEAGRHFGKLCLTF